MSRRLEDLHPVVATLARKLLFNAQEACVPVMITQTLRSMDEQATLYARGRTAPGRIVTYAKPGQSYHNYGLAFDVAILKDGTPTWDTKVDVNDNEVEDYLEVGLLGEKLGLTWGGRWRFVDLPHFQYTFGLSINDLLAGKRPPA